jgi:phosphonopyruvate decarboxylase
VIAPAAFVEALRAHGFTFFSGVPDSLLKDLCAYITDHAPAGHHVISANEGTAIGVAAGYHLATSKLPVVYLQSSGIGNIVNPLLSLADPAVYAIPMLIIVGWRGEPGVPDEPQHEAQGRLMPDLLRVLGLDADVVGAETDNLADILGAATLSMSATGRSHVLLIKKHTFAPYALRQGVDRSLPLTREQAIDAVLEGLLPDDLLVATTGMASREVFEHRVRRGQRHDRDFLTVGSMGHASQIALGLALHQPLLQTVCLDGDGAAIMHMGGLAVVGSERPRNFKHVVLNNGAHDSVGGQPTAAFDIDLCAIAAACGYTDVNRVTELESLRTAVARLRATEGPGFLEVQVRKGARADLGRPTRTPVESKAGFMRALGHGRS